MLSDNFVVLIYYRNLLQNEPEVNSVNTVKFLIGIVQTWGNADQLSHRTICIRSDSLPLYNMRNIKNNGIPRTSCIIYCALSWQQVHIISVRASFFAGSTNATQPKMTLREIPNIPGACMTNSASRHPRASRPLHHRYLLTSSLAFN